MGLVLVLKLSSLMVLTSNLPAESSALLLTHWQREDAEQYIECTEVRVNYNIGGVNQSTSSQDCKKIRKSSDALMKEKGEGQASAQAETQ